MNLKELVDRWLRDDPHADATDIADALWLGSRTLTGSTAPRTPLSQTPPASAPPTSPAQPQASPPSTNPPGTSLPDSEPAGESAAEPGSGSAQIRPTRPESPAARAGDASELSLRVPTGRALPQALALARALRPLMRRIPSRTALDLDEPATVQRIAEDGIWTPVLSPTLSRWLDIALVVDAHGSMVIWERTVHEFRRMLESLGAFRDVRCWSLDTSTPNRVVLRAPDLRTERSVNALVDPTATRLIIVATDCLGPAWLDGAVSGWLEQLGRTNHVALWHLLPERLWRQTGLRWAQFVHVTAPFPAPANARLRPALWRPMPNETLAGGPVLPVLTSEPHRISAWAHLLSGEPRRRLPAAILRAPLDTAEIDEFDEANNGETTAPPPAPTPVERVLAFRRVASPPALQLAFAFSATPLRLPIMRLVQRSLVARSDQTHLAEVFLSGLIKKSNPSPSQVPADETDYDFLPGVREVLLKASWYPELIAVQSLVSDYLQRHLGQSLDFRALVVDPSTPTPDRQDETDHYFASVTAAVLNRLGGHYADLASRLRGESQAVIPPKTTPKRTTTKKTTRAKTKKRSRTDLLFSGITLLWVDDYPSNNNQFHKRLEGANIVTALSTDGALKVLRKQKLDAIISDLGRAESAFAGLDLLEQLRKHGNQIPYAIFASKRALSHRKHALNSGALVCTNSFVAVREALIKHLQLPRKTPQPAMLWENALRELLNELQVDPDFHDELCRDPKSKHWPLLWPITRKRSDALQNLIRVISTVAGADQVRIWIVGHKELRPIFLHPQPTRVLPGDNSFHPLLEETMTLRHSTGWSDRNQPIALNSFTKDVHSLLMVPLMEARRTDPPAYGAFEFASTQADAFTDNQIKWIEAFAQSLPSTLIRRMFGAPPLEVSPRGWVLIAGAESMDKDGTTRHMAELVGNALANEGFGLVCGGWPGVDETVTQAYLDQTRRIKREPLVRQILEPHRQPRVKIVDTERTESVEESINRSVAVADGVVLLSGAGGTARIGRAAVSAGKPVFPLSATGGDARKFHRDLQFNDHYQQRYSKQDWASLADMGLDAVKGLLRLLHQDGESPAVGGDAPVVSLGTLCGHDKTILRLSWSPDATMLASCSVDQTVKIWNFRDRNYVLTLKGHAYGVNQAVWSPDGKWIATCSHDHTIRLYETQDWSCVHVFRGHTDDVTDVTWSKNGQSLATVSSDGSLRIWSIETKLEVVAHHEMTNPMIRILWPHHELIIASGLDQRFYRFAFRHDRLILKEDLKSDGTLIGLAASSRWIATASKQGKVEMWYHTLSNSPWRSPLHEDQVRSVTISPSQRLLAANVMGKRGQVVIYNTETGELVHTISEPTSDFWPPSIAWAPEGSVLATFGNRDREIRLWQINEEILLKNHPIEP